MSPISLICLSGNSHCVESIRYLDVHSVLPDETSAELKATYATLLASLLLNSALAAHKVGGTENARSAVAATTRALDRLQLSDADKGASLLPLL